MTVAGVFTLIAQVYCLGYVASLFIFFITNRLQVSIEDTGSVDLLEALGWSLLSWIMVIINVLILLATLYTVSMRTVKRSKLFNVLNNVFTGKS